MARYTQAVCKLCRRERMKLFLKGAKCDSMKCPIERKLYPPGEHGRGRIRDSEYLLQLRLVVDPGRDGRLYVLGESVDDGVLDRREAVLEEERTEHGLEEGCEDIAIVGEPFDLLGGELGCVVAQPAAEIQLPRDDRAARAGDHVGSDLREPPLREVGVPVVERVCHRELEHAVAEELEALVRRRAVVRPGDMPEHGLRQRGRQAVDQLREVVTGGW